MKLNRMSSNGKKVLLIEGIIRTVIVALCLAAALIINYFWLHWQEGQPSK